MATHSSAKSHSQKPASTRHLSDKHQKFVNGIVSGLNNAAAYRAVYPNAGRHTAENQAWRLLQRPAIIDAIERHRHASSRATVISVRQKREYLARIVRATSADFLTPGSDHLISITATPRGQTFSVPDKIAAIRLDARLAGELTR